MKVTIYGLLISGISLVGAYTFDDMYRTFASVLFGISIAGIAVVLAHWITK